MKTIKIYPTVKLNKYEDGTFSYIDTYGEKHEFQNSEEIWKHLTGDGEEFNEEIKSFIFNAPVC